MIDLLCLLPSDFKEKKWQKYTTTTPKFRVDISQYGQSSLNYSLVQNSTYRLFRGYTKKALLALLWLTLDSLTTIQVEPNQCPLHQFIVINKKIIIYNGIFHQKFDFLKMFVGKIFLTISIKKSFFGGPKKFWMVYFCRNYKKR